MTQSHVEGLARRLIALAPSEAVQAVEALPRPSLRAVCRELGRRALWATWLTHYVDYRAGYGCGDEGHDTAVHAANRASRILWCKAFENDGYVDINPRLAKEATEVQP